MFVLPESARAAMASRAEADFPEETCGLLLAEGDAVLVRPMKNIQNRLHEEDPEEHPRSARTAYCFDPMELKDVLDDIERGRHALRAIYHSHPDHDAYFSETDSAAAAPFGEPSYPGVVYLVFSVRDRKVVDLKAFDWSEAERKYVEVPFRVEG